MDYLTLRLQIASDIQKDIQLNTNLKMLRQKINAGTVIQKDLEDFSKIFGDSVSKYIKNYTSDGVESEFLSEFSNECLTPLYRQAQNTMLNVSKSAQEVKNKQSGIGMKAVDVKNDESRLVHINERFKEATSFDEVAFLTDSNVSRSVTRGAINDSLRANASAQSDAGLEILISRSDGGGCCDWCASMVGTYRSFDELPDNFWGVHRGCGCTIDYKVGRTSSKLSFKTREDGTMTKITE